MTSVAFGSQMGVGWLSGLKKIYAGKVAGLLESKVKHKKDETGDVDAAFRFRDAVGIEDILPIGRKIEVLSKGKASPKSQHFLCEIKRSCDERSVDRHVEQFIRFYTDLITNKEERRMDEFILQALRDSSTILVFLFNGAEFHKVRQAMNAKLDQGKLVGLRVAVVWCPSDSLTKWDKDLILVETTEVLRVRTAELAAAARELATAARELATAKDYIARLEWQAQEVSRAKKRRRVSR